jgi:hypothetical protein
MPFLTPALLITTAISLSLLSLRLSLEARGRSHNSESSLTAPLVEDVSDG